MPRHPSRRQFLGAATTVGAAVALGARPGVAQDDHDHGGAAQDGAMPPAIRALRPMRDGVVPISVDERRARIEKARRLMREQRHDALLLTGGTSMCTSPVSSGG